MKRNFYWIWFIGAATWFFDAALSLHYHAVLGGLLEVAVSALFLAMGIYMKKKRDMEKLKRGSGMNPR